MPKRLNKIISILISILLLLEQSAFAADGVIDLSSSFSKLSSGISSSLASSSTNTVFRPIHLRYLEYLPKDNSFKLLLDKGNTQQEANTSHSRESGNPGINPSNPITQTTQDLMQYFYIGLTLPNDAFWVNLRPDSPDNIIDSLLSQTDIGRILLEADVELKKDTASYTNPATPEGKVYWNKLYKKAEELFGTDQITIPTLTRPWIVPGEIIIRETGYGYGSTRPSGSLTISAQESNAPSAYIYKATLKVMLEEDYLKAQDSSLRGDTQSRLTKQSQNQIASPLTAFGARNDASSVYSFTDPRLKELNSYSTKLIKELIIPKLTKEVNSSKRYASLRQVYYSLIMAQWFKARYHSQRAASSLRVSAQHERSNLDSNVANLIDSKNLSNLTSKTPWNKQDYFNQYQASFTKGEYNTKETVYTPSGQVIRSYMSGGIGGIAPNMPSFGEESFVDPKTGVNITSSPATTNISRIYQRNKPFLISLVLTLGVAVNSAAAFDSTIRFEGMTQPVQAERAVSLPELSPQEIKTFSAAPKDGTRTPTNIINSVNRLIDNPGKLLPGLYEVGDYDAQKPTVIFIHGADGSPSNFEHFLKSYQNEFNILAFSYNYLDKIETNADLFRNYYADFVNRNKLSDITIVAHSYGNAVLARSVLDSSSRGRDEFKIANIVQLNPVIGSLSARGASGYGKQLFMRIWGLLSGHDYSNVALAQDPEGEIFNSIRVPYFDNFVNSVSGLHTIVINNDPNVPQENDSSEFGKFYELVRKDAVRLQSETKDPHTEVLQRPDVEKLLRSYIMGSAQVGGNIEGGFTSVLESKRATSSAVTGEGTISASIIRMEEDKTRRLLLEAKLSLLQGNIERANEIIAKIDYGLIPAIQGFIDQSRAGISKAIKKYAVSYGYKEVYSYYLDHTLMSAWALKDNYDVAVGVATKGIHMAGIFSLLGLPALLAEVHTRDGRNEFEWMGENQDMELKLRGKRIIICENDIVSGKTLNRLLDELEKYHPKQVDVFFIYRFQEAEKNIDRSRISNVYYSSNFDYPDAMGFLNLVIALEKQGLAKFSIKAASSLVEKETAAQSLSDISSSIEISDEDSGFKALKYLEGLPAASSGISGPFSINTFLGWWPKKNLIQQEDRIFLEEHFSRRFGDQDIRLTVDRQKTRHKTFFLEKVKSDKEKWAIKVVNSDSQKDHEVLFTTWVKELLITRRLKGHPGIIANDAERFLASMGKKKEAKALGDALEQGNMRQVFEIMRMYFICNGELFFVMNKLRDGMTLTDWLKNNENSRDYVIQRGIYEKIKDLVDFLHSRGVVHADLKPDNIWIGDDGSVSLFDFETAVVVAKDRQVGSDLWEFLGDRHAGTAVFMHPLRTNNLATGTLSNEQLRDFYFSLDFYDLELIKYFIRSPWNLNGIRMSDWLNMVNRFPIKYTPEAMLDYKAIAALAEKYVSIFCVKVPFSSETAELINVRPPFKSVNFNSLVAHGTNAYVLLSAVEKNSGQLRPSDDLSNPPLTGESLGLSSLNRRLVSTVGLAYTSSQLMDAEKYAVDNSSLDRVITLDNIEKRISETNAEMGEAIKNLEIERKRNKYFGLVSNILYQVTLLKKRLEQSKKKIVELTSNGQYEEYLRLSQLPVVLIGDGVGEDNVFSEIPNEVGYRRVNIRAVGVKGQDSVSLLTELLRLKGVDNIAVIEMEKLENLVEKYSKQASVGLAENSELVQLIVSVDTNSKDNGLEQSIAASLVTKAEKGAGRFSYTHESFDAWKDKGLKGARPWFMSFFNENNFCKVKPLIKGEIFERFKKRFKQMNREEGMAFLMDLSVAQRLHSTMPFTMAGLFVLQSNEAAVVFYDEVMEFLPGYNLVRVMSLSQSESNNADITEFFFINGVYVGYGVTRILNNDFTELEMQFQIFPQTTYPELGRGKVIGFSKEIFKARLNLWEEFAPLGVATRVLIQSHQYKNVDVPTFYLDLGFKPVSEPMVGDVQNYDKGLVMFLSKNQQSDVSIVSERSSDSAGSPLTSLVTDKKSGIDGLAGSPVIPQPGKLGGIDFRSLPIVTQAASNLGLNTMSHPSAQLGVNELRNRLLNFNLRSELNEIERLANAGITPSTQRIKEYVQASMLKKEIVSLPAVARNDDSSFIISPEDTQKLLSCIADILRKQEEECCATDPTLKDVLVILESGIS